MDLLYILVRILDSACLNVQILGANRNLVHRSALVSMLMSSQKLFLFQTVLILTQQLILTLELLELYWVTVIEHVVFFTSCAKLKIAFIFTSLSLNVYAFVSGCGYSSHLNKNIGGSTDMANNEARIGGFTSPYSLQWLTN